VLQRCPQRKVKQTLKELPKDLDETYARMLRSIAQTASSDDVIRLLQCLSVAIRPMRVEELAEVLALDFDGPEGAPPELKDDRPLKDRQRDVLSICSSLILLVGNDDSGVIQFSHFSVLEFLTSDRLSTSDDISQFHIKDEPAHTTLVQACLGTLLRLDDSLGLKGYASRHWVSHAQFKKVSSGIEVGMRRLFDSAEPYFAAWLKLHDIDERWDHFGVHEITDRGSPLYYASLCGFLDLAAHIIDQYPEQVNAKGGRNHSPLAAALYKRYFDVAELLHNKHRATLEVPGHRNRTPLHAASVGGLIDVAEWLLSHEANVDSQDDNDWTPINLAAENGQLEIVRRLLGYNVRIEAANDKGNTPLHMATISGHVEIVKLLLSHGANVNAQDQVYLATPLHWALSTERIEIAHLLLDKVVDQEIEVKNGRTALRLLASSLGDAAIVLRRLFDHGANCHADAKDKDGRTPLLPTRTIEMIRLLLDGGASANVKNKEEMTLLEMKFRMGEYEIVRRMVERGARVDNEQ
jgi:ankyrin repeat protein